MCKVFEDYKVEGKEEMSLNIYKTMPEISISKIAELAETTVENVTN